MTSNKAIQKKEDLISIWDEITRHSREIIAKISTDLKIVYVSPAVENYISFSRIDCLGATINAIGMPSVVNNLINAALKRVIKNKQEEQIRFSLEAKGKMRFFEMSIYPDYDESGTLVFVAAVVHDVTVETQIKQATDRSYTQKVLLAEFSKDFMHATSKNVSSIIDKTLMQVGVYLKVDRVYLFKYNFQNGFTSNTNEWVAKGIKPEKENLQSLPLVMIPDWVENHSTGKPLIVNDVKRLKPDGFIRKTLEAQDIKSLVTFPLMLDGNCIGFVGLDSVLSRRTFEKDELEVLALLANLLSNLQAKIISEAELRDHESKFKVFVESAFGAIYIFRNGRFEFVNKTFCDITGYSDKELTSKDFDYTKLFYKADNEAEKAIRERMEGNLENKTYKLRVRTKDGRLKLVKVNTTALFDSRGLYSLGVALDISDTEKVSHTIQRINQELEIKNEELKEFAYLASHNLRAPIANILGLAEHFSYALAGDTQNLQHIEGIKDSTVALQRSLDDMHRVMQVKGEDPMDTEPIDLTDTVRRVSRMIENQIKDSGIQITTDFKVNNFTYVKYHIENVFQNLMTNAIRYRSDKNQPSLHIKSEMAGDLIKISFADNGLGIDLKRHGHHIFGIYKRFHDHPESRGLGLYLVKSQLEKRGGRIEVESSLGKGTTFHIYLKAAMLSWL
jgi:PAS domain S-box-containing protein